MNIYIIVPILAVLLGLVIHEFRRRASPEQQRQHRFLNSGGFAMLAVICGIVFIGASQPEFLEGDNAELLWNKKEALFWKFGSAILGCVFLLTALYMGWLAGKAENSLPAE